MGHNKNRKNTPQESSIFVPFKFSCRTIADEKELDYTIELSAFSVLIGAVTLKGTIENAYAKAILGTIESIEAQFVINNFLYPYLE